MIAPDETSQAGSVAMSPDPEGSRPASPPSDPAAAMRKLLKGKEPEMATESKRARGLNLLELPLDILRLIITHTNDLSSLALTNSTLHNLAVPHIYSRFDIVWSDISQPGQSDSKNVDALTYGLSTLCLGNSFAYRARNMFSAQLPRGAKTTRRLDNDYASYIKKFSLGDGPDDWVSDYMITKESGKMLGTLVALAVAKMTSLETFIWDMPTGVLADIFMALASVQDQDPENQSRLERVWVRWHDNSEGSPASPRTNPGASANAQGGGSLGNTITPVGVLVPSSANHPRPRPALSYAESTVEFPTFSILPPLKSLSVLDIDEVAYVDEMAAVIERSKDRLEELRVGIAAKASVKDFVQSWDGPDLHQIDHNARWPGESVIGERRLGGVLGVLVGRIYDIRKNSAAKKKGNGTEIANGDGSDSISSQQGSADQSKQTDFENGSVQQEKTSQQTHFSGNAEVDSPSSGESPPTADTPQDQRRSVNPRPQKQSTGHEEQVAKRRLDDRLRLRILELERVPLSSHVCRQALDWSLLSTLTLLDCAHSEALWKMLRKQFQPTAAHHSRRSSGSQLQYHLVMKSIHTDSASPALISFLKETLAPNTLEVLFLQDRRRALPAVSIEQIFKGPIRRHRSSLRKLLLDKPDHKATPNGIIPDSDGWLKWVLPTKVVLFMMSGAMNGLRELSVCLHHKDWHTFIQKLPNLPHLRSLHLPKIAAEHAPAHFDSRELAMQIVDIISLRPEIQLCYVGIVRKCFEILESKSPEGFGNLDVTSGQTGLGVDSHQHAPNLNHDDDGDDDDGTEDGEDGSEANTTEPDVDNQGNGQNGEGDGDHDDTSALDVDSKSEASTDSEADSFRLANFEDDSRLRLREILFYDDRVAIFKARHGRL